MDSKQIAFELEKRYPLPSMHLDSPILLKVEEIHAKVFAALLGVFMPWIRRNLVTPASLPHFTARREQRWGMSFEQLEEERGGEPAWENAKPHLEDMARLLKENSEGPFFMGSTVSYADFLFVTTLKSFQRAHPPIFERAVGHDDAFRKLFQACERWMERDT